MTTLPTGGLHWTIRDFRPSTEWKPRGHLRVGGVEEPEKFYRVIKQFVRGT